jgi:AI-2E family transporter
MTLLAFDGWTYPVLVLGLVICPDAAANVFIEPYLYGRGVGVSEAAALVMVAFWTWLWGPVGILLATPLTACLVVIARHVPELSVLDTLLGDRPALEPPVRLYQRLLARDFDEATGLAEQSRTDSSLVETYDALLVPALSSACASAPNRRRSGSSSYAAPPLRTQRCSNSCETRAPTRWQYPSKKPAVSSWP